MLYYRRNTEKIFPTTMLASLVNNNSSITDIYIEVIVDIQCQLHHLNLEECFMQQKQENNLWHLCYHLCSYT